VNARTLLAINELAPDQACLRLAPVSVQGMDPFNAFVSAEVRGLNSKSVRLHPRKIKIAESEDHPGYSTREEEFTDTASCHSQSDFSSKG
jgi:hypothetical protein